MIFKGSILGGAHHFGGDPYLKQYSTTILFDTEISNTGPTNTVDIYTFIKIRFIGSLLSTGAQEWIG